MCARRISSARCGVAARAWAYRKDWKKAYVKLAEGEKMIEYAENL